MKLNFPLQKIVMALIALAVAFTVMVFPVSTASAEKEKPPSPIPGLGRIPDATLTRILFREKASYDSINIVVRDAYQLAKNFQKFITTESKRGRDVSELDAALVAFNTEIEISRTIHAESGRLLGLNSGFHDVSYAVLNRQDAGATILGVRDTLRDAHFRMRTAIQDLERVYKHWRGKFIRK